MDCHEYSAPFLLDYNLVIRYSPFWYGKERMALKRSPSVLTMNVPF